MEAMRVANDFTALDKLFAKKPEKGKAKDDDKDDEKQEKVAAN